MMARPADNLVCIGVGVRAHGIRGEVRLASLSEVPGRFAKGMEVIWRRSGFPDRRLTIAHYRDQGSKVFIKFTEIPDRTAAEALNGGRVWTDIDTSPQLAEEDGYYHHQLLGLAVSDEVGEPLGKLVVNPHRPNRIEPRVRKRRPKSYPLMTAPRRQLKKKLAQQ